MAAYILFGIEAKHLLTAVIMTAPGTIMMAKMLVPETEVPKTMGTVQAGGGADRRQRDRRGRPRHRRRAAAGAERRRDADLVPRADRAGQRTSLGVRATSACSRSSAGCSRRWRGRMGVPWRDAPTIGNLLGTRMALNEFVAYSQLGPLKASARSEVVHDRDLRAVRLRELQLDRHPDRRHRRAGAEPPPRSGAARAAGDVRRHAGQLHDRDDCRVPAVAARR